MSNPGQRQREKDLKELESFVARGMKGPKSMTAQELKRFDELSRRAAVSLAQARTRITDRRMRAYLNDLVARSYQILTLQTPRPRVASPGILGSLLLFPRVVVRRGWYHLGAAALFFVGVALAFFVTLADPLAAYSIMPQGETRLPGARAEYLEQMLESGRGGSGGEKFAFASMLFGHNTRVGILSLTSGILAGIPTIFLIVYNGMILGAFTATHWIAGIHNDYWAWILPHGIPEITALVLMGGMGLRLGHVLLSPGRKTRSVALGEAGREAVVVIAGSATLLLVAAIIESYVRQSHMDANSRHLVSISGALLLTTLFTLALPYEKRQRDLL